MYCWFTDVSGFGLVEQARILTHPDPPKNEEDLAKYVEMWQDNMKEPRLTAMSSSLPTSSRSTCCGCSCPARPGSISAFGRQIVTPRTHPPPIKGCRARSTTMRGRGGNWIVRRMRRCSVAIQCIFDQLEIGVGGEMLEESTIKLEFMNLDLRA